MAKGWNAKVVLVVLLCLPQIALAGDKSLKISGFVDVGMELTRDHQAKTNKFTFRLYEAEIDFIKQLSKNFKVRADLNFVAGGGDVSTALSLIDHAFEQAYIETMIPIGKWEIYARLGKFNAPIGFEAIDPVDRYEITQSLLFAKAGPSNLTGLLVGVRTGYLDLAFHVTNGWDQLTDDKWNDKHFGLYLGLSFDFINVGLGAITGKGTGLPIQTGVERITVIDLNVSTRLLDKKLLLAVQGNVAIGSGGNAKDKKWFGAQVTVHYMPIKYIGGTLRYSLFYDKDGLGDPAAKTQFEQATIALVSNPIDAVKLFAEYRMDLQNGRIATHFVGFKGVYAF